MKLGSFGPLLGLLVALSALVGCSKGSSDVDVHILDARVKAPVPGQSISAGYFTLKNHGLEDVVLVAVSSEQAERVEMHTHKSEDGLMRMVKVDDIEVGARESLMFMEGGYHLMIFSPNEQAIESGELSLRFELHDGSTLDVVASVEQLVPHAQESGAHLSEHATSQLESAHRHIDEATESAVEKHEGSMDALHEHSSGTRTEIKEKMDALGHP